MTDARMQLVADGYDTMADTWERWSSHIGNDPRADWLGNHVPRELLAGVFERIHGWLRPGGLFLASLGASDVEGWHGNWLGVPMYFSSFTPGRNRELLTSFDVIEDEVVAISEADGEARFQWVLARR